MLGVEGAWGTEGGHGGGTGGWIYLYTHFPFSFWNMFHAALIKQMGNEIFRSLYPFFSYLGEVLIILKMRGQVEWFPWMDDLDGWLIQSSYRWTHEYPLFFLGIFFFCEMYFLTWLIHDKAYFSLFQLENHAGLSSTHFLFLNSKKIVDLQ